MSRLDLAAERLAAALENLEKTAQSRRTGGEIPPETEARMEALETQRQSLIARIAALEEELAALTGITEEVEDRLDGAIGEIRAALSR